MLDLDSIDSKPIEIKINKAVVKVNQPSFGLAKRVRTYERNLSEMKEDDIYKEQANILVSFLNNNSSSKEFSEKDIEELTFNAIRALYNGLVNSIMGIENNPN
ncbi:hypothetical protein [Clostridium sp.]|uniref:hypothetical protein n=1 Tax=Clostridium sp. TaxID=1506 RepID=UPI002FC738D5